MYRVQGTMRENYYAPDQEQDAMPRRSNLEAPRVTVGNKRMTNIQLPGGEVVQGIRTNKDLGYDGAPEAAFEAPMPLKPLRYNPGLKCDPALEAMRPERSPKHKSISAGDKRIPQPQMPAMEPMPAMVEPMMMAPAPQGPPMMVPGPYMAPMNPYEAPYPSDLLSQIKMRNRRFQQSCAMEGASLGVRPQPMAMMGPEDAMAVASMAYTDLQRQVNMLQTIPSAPIPPPRLNFEEDSLTVDMLPAPRRVVRAETKEAVPAPLPVSARGVGLGDQIAIRSYVLGKTL